VIFSINIEKKTAFVKRSSEPCGPPYKADIETAI